MVLAQTGPLGPGGEVYVDYGDGFGSIRVYPRVIDTRPKPLIVEEDLSELAIQYGVSIEAIAIAHGIPDSEDEEAQELYAASFLSPLSLPIEGILAFSLHRSNTCAFIEELFISGDSRGSGLGPLLIRTIFDRLPNITEVHLATNRDSSPDSPESCYRRLDFRPTPTRSRAFPVRMSTSRIYMSVNRTDFRAKRRAYVRSRGESHRPHPHSIQDRIDIRKLDPNHTSHSSPDSQGLNQILLELHTYHNFASPIRLDPPNLVPTILSRTTHIITISHRPDASAPPPTALGPLPSEICPPHPMGVMASTTTLPGSRAHPLPLQEQVHMPRLGFRAGCDPTGK